MVFQTLWKQRICICNVSVCRTRSAVRSSIPRRLIKSSKPQFSTALRAKVKTNPFINGLINDLLAAVSKLAAGRKGIELQTASRDQCSRQKTPQKTWVQKTVILFFEEQCSDFISIKEAYHIVSGLYVRHTGFEMRL